MAWHAAGKFLIVVSAPQRIALDRRLQARNLALLDLEKLFLARQAFVLYPGYMLE